MPTGKQGTRTIVNFKCFICKVNHSKFKGSRLRTCGSNSCINKLNMITRKINKLKAPKKEVVIVETKLERSLFVSKHLETMFTGGYDGSRLIGNNNFVTCNEGEIL
jgi:hypothetical protein